MHQFVAPRKAFKGQSNGFRTMKGGTKIEKLVDTPSWILLLYPPKDTFITPKILITRAGRLIGGSVCAGNQITRSEENTAPRDGDF